MAEQEIIVDRAARDAAAELLRRFINGKVTNDDFEDGEPQTHDPAIPAIWQTCWVFYDDMKEHKLEGGYRLEPDQRRQMARWILFLDSDLPYLWPEIWLPGIDPRPRVKRSLIGRILSFGGLRLAQVEEFLATGHYPVWPFASRQDYDFALASPKRLSGGAFRRISEVVQ